MTDKRNTQESGATGSNSSVVTILYDEAEQKKKIQSNRLYSVNKHTVPELSSELQPHIICARGPNFSPSSLYRSDLVIAEGKESRHFSHQCDIYHLDSPTIQEPVGKVRLCSVCTTFNNH